LATLCWLLAGVVPARQVGWPWAIAAALVGLFVSRRAPRLALAAVLVGFMAGHLASARDEAELNAALPGAFDALEIVATSDSRPSRYGGAWAEARPTAILISGHTVAWSGPRIALDLPAETDLTRGERYRIEGLVRGDRIKVSEAEPVRGPINPLVRTANALRRHVLERLGTETPERSLLAGFLVGDTTGLPQADEEALRAAGLSHFVAVSGSNVAGFLLLFWIALGPLGVGPRRRGALGLLGLLVFAMATRWEPSVIRASAMAGVVLMARAFGYVVDTWVAFAAGIGTAVLWSPGLITDLGFQLSVAATAGILLGADCLPGGVPAIVRKPLGVGISAQLAVAPILLATFGEIPLFSPATNLVAAPLVAGATLTAAVGVVSPFGFLIDLAALLGGAVLWIGRTAAWLPQVTAAAALALTGAVMLAVRMPRVRPLGALAAVALIVAHLIGTGLRGPALVFLDIGQGDAALLAGADGRIVLIDAGPDPRALWAALRRHRVTRIDLLVATHPHDDHIGGMVGLAGRIPIGTVWYGGGDHESTTWEQVVLELDTHGVPRRIPTVGSGVAIGEVTIEVLGPERRYESANDQSIVLLIRGPSPTVLMTGDIEVAAQRDLEPFDVDVLKVPHHGGATSLVAWLLATTPELAVVSVGANSFGHPHAEVIEALVSAGVEVARTDHSGDISVAFQESR